MDVPSDSPLCPPAGAAGVSDCFAVVVSMFLVTYCFTWVCGWRVQRTSWSIRGEPNRRA